MSDSPAHRILSKAQRAGDPLDEIRALNGSGEVPSRVVTTSDRPAVALNEQSPAEAFDTYLAEHERDLPDRYRYPGRRTSHPYYGGPAIGLAVVVVGLVGRLWFAGSQDLRRTRWMVTCRN